MPDWAPHVRARLASLRLSPTRETEIVDELSQHLEDRYRELIAGGAPPDEATRLALADFQVGNVLAQKMASLRQARVTASTTLGAPTGHVLSDLWQDVRYAARIFQKQPAFAATAVVTLALGIGVTTATFSVVNAVLLKSLPYPEPDRLVVLYSQTASWQKMSSSYANFLDWARENRSFSDLAAFRPDDMNLIGLGLPERVPVEMVSASFFRLLGVQPIHGRAFLPADDQLGAAPAALISESFWKRKFGSSPTAVGQTLTLSGTSYVIIGVIPATFQNYAGNFLRRDVYLPIGAWNAPGFRNRQVAMGMDVIGRLKPSVSLEQASAEMQSVARNLAEQYPVVNEGIGITLVPLKAAVVRRLQGYIVAVQGLGTPDCALHLRPAQTIASSRDRGWPRRRCAR
jgi:hypothetical protein